MNWDDLDNLEDECEELNELDDLFYNLDIEEPNDDQLFEMYGIFLKDFIKEPIIVNGVKLTFNRNISRHPLCRNKYVGFEHIITRKSEVTGKRLFDRERANKIHWIKPIINNVRDSRIKYFEQLNNEGNNQLYYWYEEKEFIIILRELNPNLILITSFSVDYSYKKNLEESYLKYYN